MPIATQRTLGSKRQRRPLWSSREAFYTDLGLFGSTAMGRPVFCLKMICN